MRYASLGSGSSGNALLIETGGTRVLVDCGFSLAELERRLLRLGCEPASLDAVLVTHEHNDHIGCASLLSRRHRLPVWMTVGTFNALCERGARNGVSGEPSFHAVETFHAHDAFALDGLNVEPYPVPHDAREPSQFVFGDGVRRIGLLTDTGHITPHIERMLTACDALLVECNHDSALLAAGPYPQALKARVGGRFGHLSNAQTAELLARLDLSRLQHIAALHLSDTNNRPDLAAAAVSAALGCEPDWVTVADQAEGFGWRDVA